LKGNVPTAEIKPIPLPESPYGRFSISYQNPLQMTTVVYRGAEDPVSAVRYLDFMAARSTALVLKYGLEGIHWRLGPNGCPVAIDKEKNSKELVYIPDLAMQTSPELLGDCNETENDFDPNVPEQQEYLDIIREARYWYESPERPIPDLAIPEHMPTLPSTLSRIHQELMEQISDIWAKAVVSGPAYTIEEALADAQAVWYRGGGRELEAWYADWYEANKDTAFLAHDIYKFLHH